MLQRYSNDGEFTDPVVRCCECSHILLREQIQKSGGCSYCGTRRVRNVLNMTGAEMDELKAKGIDEAFIALFEGVLDA